MSKELVISSTRHETRLAILEDDQVVEVYHQRENEYSLAGSIHKGRVTRVLPGMQSAFVDIGLERDAFLYVSDFFEDNEEYDKIVSTVEEKVLRFEKGAVTAPVAGTVSEAPVVQSALLPTRKTQETAPESSAASEGAAEAAPGVTDRDGRDRRGRRSRRRRPKGRGLPESKYYLPTSRPQAAPAVEETAEAGGDDDDFFVLPGESLAKYSRADQLQPDVPTAVEQSELESETTEESPSEISSEESATGEGPTVESVVEEPVASPAPAESSAEGNVPEATAFARSEDIVEETEQRPESADSEAPINSSATAVAQASEPAPVEEAEPALQVAAGVEPSPFGEDTPAAELETEPEPEASASSLEAGEADVEEEETQPENPEEAGPEPARIPTSLTATLREQGPRYLHRVSRRMRRKARGERGPDAAREVRTPDIRPDVRSAPRPEAARTERGAPSITDLLREGQEIIVQIAKEPLGQKGARITSHIALPGRFLVYMPTVDHIGVSRKIASDEERARLKRVLQANRAGIPGGFIVRTAGENRAEEELRNDMLFLYNLWMDLRQKAEKKPAPALIHHDLDVVERVLRDQLNAEYKNIWVDNEEVYEGVLRFVQRFQPAMVGRIKLYTRPNPIFDEFGVTAELEKALRPKVWLKSGGYIVINQTEALVAIDVNTGKYVGKSNRLEDTIVKTNTDAVREIVRQIRLRDLGGIIVVDFIDMDERKNRQKVMQALEEAMRSDRAPYKILQFNDFGLVAITRKRVKQSLERTLCAPCPYCEGAGYVKSVQTVVSEILQEAQKMAKLVEGDVTLRVNPEVAKVLKSNRNTFLQEIEEILGRNVLVKADPMLHQEKFDLA